MEKSVCSPIEKEKDVNRKVYQRIERSCVLMGLIERAWIGLKLSLALYKAIAL
jgi:hypothetical protein